jgi:tRNA G10  N-methylase Trm11
VLNKKERGYLMATLRNEEIVDRWSMIVKNGQGKAEEVFKDTEEYIEKSEAPQVEFERVKVSTSFLGGVLGNERTYIRIVNKNLKCYKMYVGARDYGKNPGDISDFWDIIKKSSDSDHCASYNARLITKPIIAGCPKDGIVLDPFCGSGTTLARALELGRKFIGIDGKKEYCRIAEDRITKHNNKQ